MLIITLTKGVPARTTKVVSVGGVLNREAMDLVLNPHDAKAVEAADFVKRKVGGKIVAVSMGPDAKLIPLMRPLYDAEVCGVDEECVLSDRKMAGADTLATSYAVALGIKKVVERHQDAVEDVIKAVKQFGYSEATRNAARALYEGNLLPNKIYSDLPAVRDSIVQRFLEGKLTPAEAVDLLQGEKEALSKFVVLSGIKTTDGETGSVGPQVAEAVSELLHVPVPHATYVDDFDVDAQSMVVESERKIGLLSQKLEMRLPSLLTVSPDYRPRPPGAAGQIEVRLNNSRGKTPLAIKWNADELKADPQRLGFQGSPTIVGPGIDIGKPPVQKVVGRSLVFLKEHGEVEDNGKKYGPFERGDLADGLPQALLESMKKERDVGVFTTEMLGAELLK